MRAELDFFEAVTNVSGKLYAVPKDERKAAAVREVQQVWEQLPSLGEIDSSDGTDIYPAKLAEKDVISCLVLGCSSQEGPAGTGEAFEVSGMPEGQ